MHCLNVFPYECVPQSLDHDFKYLYSYHTLYTHRENSLMQQPNFLPILWSYPPYLPEGYLASAPDEPRIWYYPQPKLLLLQNNEWLRLHSMHAID